ncbi:hypothetical protein INP51_14055 [Blautia liquoris]|uniref:Uncharacterized protein n=1 Tax=Blautia liquoris TaxID=2779518 RepID=A0A7M2RGE3_9FIRM|nr:hypothetical protein [Blautia liquoris]QOV19064.1 hypothetical protein INP51_14055 [Blautia liquoris]
MKQIILYLKAAILSGAAALLIMVSLLYAGMEVLDVFFWMLIVFLIGYFSILAVIEERRVHEED